MKKTLIIGTLVTILCIQCAKEKDPFLITSGAIGNLSKDIQMKQVDSVFALDSIIKLSPIQNAIGTQGDVEIFEKGGKKLLSLAPLNESDPNSVITNIQIFDDRYKTDKGLNASSTFKEVKDNYTIANIERTINSVVVFLEDSDVFITIDEKQLPENLRYNPNITIEASGIPDGATFKYFMLGWDPTEENSEEVENSEG